MTIQELLEIAGKYKASDIHITTGIAPVLRVHGELQSIGTERLTPQDTKELIYELLQNEIHRTKYEINGEVDFSYAQPGVGRYRVNVYKQRGSDTAAIRLVASEIPTMESLGLPTDVLKGLCDQTRGLVLVTGPTGSGKSTTLATMIDYINKSRKCHILTLEDPIEYLHRHGSSIVNQREIGTDSATYASALRAALREDPDVILVGEMRDLETISIAITAAETGHLVLSTLHTIGAVQTIDRIVDVFPHYQQQQIRVQLANILKGVVSQQLLPRKDTKGRALAMELLTSTPATSNLIREGKNHQIYSQIQTGVRFGMSTMENSLVKLYQEGKITLEQARNHTQMQEELKRLMGIGV